MKDILSGKKKIIIGTILVFLVGGVIYLTQFKRTNQTIQLKDDEYVIEYGTTPSLEINDYINLESLSEDIRNDVLSHAELIIDIENEEGEEYPPIGEYKCELSYKNETISFQLIIADTTSPSITNIDQLVETYVDVVPKYEDIFEIVDLSDFSLEIDDSQVRYDEIGEYTAKITVTDIYDNSTESDFKIKINEPILQVTQSKVELNINETVLLEVTAEGKSDKVTFKSSDKSVITVDENGQIKTIKKGTAKVTISADGKEIVVEVTVNTENTENTNVTTTNPNTSTNATTSNSNSSTSTPSPSGTTATPSNSSTSNNDNSNTNGSISTNPSTPPPSACSYTKGNSGKLFSTEGEANTEAKYQFANFDDGIKFISRYWVWSTCDKWTIEYEYTYWE